MTLLGLTLGTMLAATQPSIAPAPTPPEADPAVPLAARALAQEAQPASSKQKRPRVIRLEELKIEGRIQKPQAFYLLQRSNLNFDDLARDERFLEKVVESVEKAPF